MSDANLLLERLQTVLTALERIPRRCVGISQPSDFFGERCRNRPYGCDLYDPDRLRALPSAGYAIAVGEEFKKIDRQTEGKLFARYPQVQWRGAIGLRDVLAHGYFDVDTEQLYTICMVRIPPLIEAVKTMIADLEQGAA